MQRKKIFLASSAELLEDREQFEIFINRKNKDWHDRGIFLHLIVWEDFLDALSKTRLQDEYNKTIRACDIFVMLFWTKVGMYTAEEFEVAVGQFKSVDKPFVFTYFKDVDADAGSADPRDQKSLEAFKKKLKALGHFPTVYKNIDQLKFHFNHQLDLLYANGFTEFHPELGDLGPVGDNNVIANGPGATAIGHGSVYIGGRNSGNVNLGTQNIDTGGGAYIGGSMKVGGDFVGRDKITRHAAAPDLDKLFAPLRAAVARQPTEQARTLGARLADELMSELAKGKRAEDGRIGTALESMAAELPGVSAAVLTLFAKPLPGVEVGPVTRYMLAKFKTV